MCLHSTKTLDGVFWKGQGGQRSLADFLKLLSLAVHFCPLTSPCVFPLQRKAELLEALYCSCFGIVFPGCVDQSTFFIFHKWVARGTSQLSLNVLLRSFL